MLTLLLTALFVAPSASAAQTAVDPSVVSAEVHRLREELILLARKNAWTGVDRVYGEMESLAPAQLQASDHWTAAQAAASEGDVALAVRRVRCALATGEPVPEAREWLAGIARRYGKVHLDGRTLEAAHAPFAPDEVAAVRHAALTLDEEGSFDGLLPVGKYRVGRDLVVVRAAKER